MQSCQDCHIGRMLLRKTPYIQWYDDDSIIVDRIPALVCDSCGEKSYDMQAFERLQHLLWATSSDRPVPPLRGYTKPIVGHK